MIKDINITSPTHIINRYHAGVVEGNDANTYIVDYDTMVTVNASAIANHHVAGWEDENDNDLSNVAAYSDYFVTTPQNSLPAKSSIAINITGDTTLTALFDINNYNVTASVATTADMRGTVSANYTPSTGSETTVGPATNITISPRGNTTTTLYANPAAGYHFVGWYAGVSPATIVSTKDTITITDDTIVIAYFDTTHTDLAWSAPTFTGYTNIDFNNWAPTVSNPHNVEIRYGYEMVTGTLDSLIIDASTGVIGYDTTAGHLQFETGTYNVYVVHDNSQEYFYDSVAYTLTIERSSNIFIQPNIPTAGEVRFSDYTTTATLTHRYNPDATSIVKNAYVAHDNTIRVEAEPNSGYHFTKWQKGITPPGITTLSTDNPYTHTALDTYAEMIVGVFDTNSYNVAYTIQNDTRPFGTGLPMGNVTLVGRHTHFLFDTLTATADYGYSFDGWYVGDSLVSNDNPFAFSPVSDITYDAHFTPDTFEVVARSQHASTGSVRGSGRYPYLYPVVLYADSVAGTYFDQWNDGNSDNPRTVVLTQDTDFTATFNLHYYLVNFGSADSTQGSVIGDRDRAFLANYMYTAHFKAIPNDGYFFHHWNNGLTEDSITVRVVSDTNIVAYFEAYPLNVRVLSADTVKGTTSGSGNYDYNSTVTVSATANYGYSFTQWNDGNTDNPRIITVSTDTTLTAQFAINQYTVTVNSADSTMGTVAIEGQSTVDYLSPVTITATSGEDFLFQQWNDGNSDNPRTITVTGDTTFTAIFAPKQYTLTLSVNDDQMGSVALNTMPSGVTDNGDGTYTVNSGTEVTIVANTTKRCYDFMGWDNTNTGTYLPTMTITVVSDTAIQALFGNHIFSSDTTAVACDQFAWHGVTYIASETLAYHTNTPDGCDSIVTLNLTINNSSTSIDVQFACDSYTWIDGVTYTASTNTPIHVYTNTQGCDSTVTLHLTVGSTTGSDTTVVACDEFTWHGVTYTSTPVVDPTYTYYNSVCSSTVTLHLTINHSNSGVDVQNHCGSYTWIDGITYTASTNTPIHVYTNTRLRQHRHP